MSYGGPQRQYTNIYYITSFCILVRKHIHWLCEYICQYNKIYTSTTICIPVQKCSFQYKNILKLQYGKISPILSTQITAPLQKKLSISQCKNIGSRTNIFIGCATIFLGTVKFMYTTVQQYVSQYRNINPSTKIKVALQKNIMPRPLDRGNAALA